MSPKSEIVFSLSRGELGIMLAALTVANDNLTAFENAIETQVVGQELSTISVELHRKLTH